MTITLAPDKMASLLPAAPTCPGCRRSIPGDDINVAKDIAFCRNCNLSYSFSGLVSGNSVDANVDVNNPPPGTWFRRDGDGMAMGATHRSLALAGPMLFFTLFWNGIVSVFVLEAAVSTWRHLGFSVPSWLPASFTKSAHMPFAMALFLWVFLTPFIAIGIMTFCTFLNYLAGRTEVRVQGGHGVLFSGVGPIGSRRHFAASDVKDVRIDESRWRDDNGNRRQSARILIDIEPKPIRLGSMLTPERRQFLAGALKKELLRR